MKNPSNQFEEIIHAAKERRGDLTIDTMIVSSHLAQMRLFILRRGVEFYCEQDSYGYRKEFIAKVCEENMLDMKNVFPGTIFFSINLKPIPGLSPWEPCRPQFSILLGDQTIRGAAILHVGCYFSGACRSPAL